MESEEEKKDLATNHIQMGTQIDLHAIHIE